MPFGSTRGFMLKQQRKARWRFIPNRSLRDEPDSPNGEAAVLAIRGLFRSVSYALGRATLNATLGHRARVRLDRCVRIQHRLRHDTNLARRRDKGPAELR